MNERIGKSILGEEDEGEKRRGKERREGRNRRIGEEQKERR